MQVLAGVEQADDPGGPGNFAAAMFQIQAAPPPGMVCCRTWCAPRRMPPASTRPASTCAGSKAAMQPEESRSRTGYPLVTGLVPGEEDGEPGLAGAAVFALAVPPGGLPGGDRHAAAASRPSRPPSPARSHRRTPYPAPRHRRRIPASSGPGPKDLLAHPRDPLADRRELAMPGDLPPHLPHPPAASCRPTVPRPPGGGLGGTCGT
jgi:hypothetical protein